MKLSDVDFDNVAQIESLGLLPFDSTDPDTQPNGVLVNRWGITNTEDLNCAERGVTKIILTSDSFPSKTQGHFDLHHLRTIHRAIFNDIYPWAGDLRKIDINKGDTLFCGVLKIEETATQVFDELKTKKYLIGLSAEDFSSEAGLLMSSINMIHPFREGNGRTQRIFIQRIAHNAGYILDWASVSDDAMRNASIAAENNNPRALQRLIQLNITNIGDAAISEFITL